MHPKDALGRQGEQLAAEYLQRAGFRILDRNWRCAEGEIDIVAADRRVLVACEVKTRSGVAVRHPARGRHPAEAAPAAAARGPLGEPRTACSSTSCASTWSACCRTQSGEFTIEHLRGVG